jgi:hypothetical protein
MNSSLVKAIACCAALAALLGLSSAVAAERGALRVGAARVDITPPPNPAYPPSGKYDHESLYVRAIVLDNGLTRAALIGVDLVELYEDIWASASKQIAEDLKCPVENIIMSATHSHSALAGGPPSEALFRQEGWNYHAESVRARVPGAMVEAVQQAKAKLQPAKVGFGTGACYLNVNRDAPLNDPNHLWTQAANLNGPSDKTVAVVTFTAPGGEPIAAYMNYAMHGINGSRAGITSADFPGAACRYVEKAFDDKMVMVFTQGASGDQMPLHMRPAVNAMAAWSGVKITGYELVREDVEKPLREGRSPLVQADPKVLDNLERWMESQGEVLGEEAIRVMTHTKSMNGDVALWGGQKMLTCPGRRRATWEQHQGVFYQEEGKPETFEDSDPVHLRIGMLGIGDIALTTVDGEVYTMISQRMKKNSPMANTVMVTLADGLANSGYIYDDASSDVYTFEVLSSRLKPGCAERGIADGLDGLITEYMTK